MGAMAIAIPMQQAECLICLFLMLRDAYEETRASFAAMNIERFLSLYQ
jgi:hypothetical protein